MLARLTLAWLGLSEPSLTLDWQAPAGCPSRAEVVAELERVLPEQGPIPSEGRGRVHAQVEVVEQGDRWQVELTLTSQQGQEQRSFAAERCSLAADATVLVIAVAIDPVATARARVTPDPPIEAPALPEPPPEPESPPEPPPEPPQADAHAGIAEAGEPASLQIVFAEPHPREPRRRASLRVALAIFAGGGYGPLRAGAGQLELRVALVGERFRWETRGAWLVPVEVGLDAARTGRFDGWVIGSRGCGVPGGSLRAGERVRLELPLCVGLEAGQLRGAGARGVPNPVAVTRPYAALEAGPGLRVRPLERLAIGFELDAVIPLVALGFSINGDPVLRNSPVGVRALAGVELRLP